METLAIDIRPLAEDELDTLERHMSVDWAALVKHRERLAAQQKGEVVYLVAWLGDIPIGHALLKWEGAEEDVVASRLRDCPDIEDLFVLPRHRSKGVGSLLLARAEEMTREHGYLHIGLAVATDNPGARSLYERLGYDDAGFGPYRIGGRVTDLDGVEHAWEEYCDYLVKRLD